MGELIPWYKSLMPWDELKGDDACVTVLTENDWKTVQNALQRMEHIELERIFAPKKVRVVVTTEPTDKPWKVAMIVTVKVFRGHCSWYQNYESMEAARRALLDWKGYG